MPRFATPPHAADTWVLAKHGFDGENGSYVINRETKQYWHLDPSFGEICDFWPGALPQPSETPAIRIDRMALLFAGNGIDTVRITNAGGGTLGTISAAGRSAWLSVSVTGSGNTQYAVNTVNANLLEKGVYADTVTLSSPGASDSVTYTVTLSAGGALSAPVIVAVSAPGSGKPVMVTWNDRSIGEERFSVERSADQTAWVEAGNTGANAVSFADSQLAASGTYWYRVRAVAGIEYSAYSVPMSVAYMAASAIVVLAPQAGAVWPAGSIQQVQWTAEEAVGPVGISFSLDGGESWLMLHGTSISRTDAVWGNCQVTVPAAGCDTAYVKVYEYFGVAGVETAVGPLRFASSSALPFRMLDRVQGIRASTDREGRLIVDAAEVGCVVRLFGMDGRTVCAVQAAPGSRQVVVDLREHLTAGRMFIAQVDAGGETVCGAGYEHAGSGAITVTSRGTAAASPDAPAFFVFVSRLQCPC